MPPKRYFRARVYRPSVQQQRVLLLTRRLYRAGLPLRVAARIAGQFLRPLTLSQRLAKRRRR